MIPNKPRKLQNKLIYFLAIVFTALVCGLIFLYINIVGADSKNNPEAPKGENSEAVSGPETIENPSDNRFEVTIPILMYHHIRTYNDPNDQIGNNLSVPESNFKQQIDYLKNNGFITITFADFLSFPTKKLPDKPVILTFDDGYSDSFGAYNLLKENNQLGVFYIITSYFEKSEHLSVKQVKNMAENDMEIGSHTASHPDLTKSSSEKINFEVVESKKILENILGKNVISFCYPSGKHNVKVEETVKNAGYLTATTTDYALSDTSENKMTLSRIRINPSDTLNGFAKKIEILK